MGARLRWDSALRMTRPRQESSLGGSTGCARFPKVSLWPQAFRLLQALAAGGVLTVGFARPLILSTVYLVIAAVWATGASVRKDVTARVLCRHASAISPAHSSPFLT
jgi:hypothetical protein